MRASGFGLRASAGRDAATSLGRYMCLCACVALLAACSDSPKAAGGAGAGAGGAGAGGAGAGGSGEGGSGEAGSGAGGGGAGPSGGAAGPGGMPIPGPTAAGGAGPGGGGAGLVGMPIPEPTAAGGVEGTFDHMNGDVDIWDVLRRMQEEGPPRFAARAHGCPKMKYRTLGRVLASRGVDLASMEPGSAGRLWREGDQALGAPNYAARIPEAPDLTTASASKMFDIFVAAAPEVIASLATRPECTVGGVPTAMFNAQGQCTADGVTCLLGVPAQGAHLELCNRILGQASTPERGRIIAVAALMAAANTCE